MQITMNFDIELTDSYFTCREYIGYCVHNLGKAQRDIAAAMDYSSSDLTRKISQSPGDTRRFTLDDLETYITATGDIRPLTYLVGKFAHLFPAAELAATPREKEQGAVQLVMTSTGIKK